ncbi:hypothetical protein, partial [Citrobacter freundii]|uniref:hypothetical protein n=1 Tax=Citrobacter freundii TaxID=546 RepID=UPI003D6EF570
NVSFRSTERQTPIPIEISLYLSLLDRGGGPSPLVAFWPSVYPRRLAARSASARIASSEGPRSSRA